MTDAEKFAEIFANSTDDGLAGTAESVACKPAMPSADWVAPFLAEILARLKSGRCSTRLAAAGTALADRPA